MKRTFSTDIQVFGESLKGRCDILLRSTVLNLMQDLHDEQMPVETGWLRSSFMVTVNAPGVGTNPSTRPGKHDPVLPIPQLPLPQMQFGDTVYVTNNVPYTRYVPKAIHLVKMALQRATRNIAKIARTLNK